MRRTVLSWSGGKDSAMALYELRRADVAVEELLTTVSLTTGRSGMHGVRSSVIRAQAAAVGLPLTVIELPDSPSNETYRAIMEDRTTEFAGRGFDTIAFGDLRLEDVRAYREELLANGSIDGHWPVWGRDSDELVSAFLEAGFEAIVVAVHDDYLDESVAGARFDRSFLGSLPDGVDPAGENGEFHTLVVNGPGFDRPLAIERGEIVRRSVDDKTVMHYRDVRLRT